MSIQISAEFDYNQQQIRYGIAADVSTDLSAGYTVALLDRDGGFLTAKTPITQQAEFSGIFEASQHMGLEGSSRGNTSQRYALDPRLFPDTVFGFDATDAEAHHPEGGRYSGKQLYIYRGDPVYYDEVQTVAGNVVETNFFDPMSFDPYPLIPAIQSVQWEGSWLVPRSGSMSGRRLRIESASTDHFTLDDAGTLEVGTRFDVWPVREIVSHATGIGGVEISVTGYLPGGLSSTPAYQTGYFPGTLLAGLAYTHSGSASSWTFVFPEGYFEGANYSVAEGDWEPLSGDLVEYLYNVTDPGFAVVQSYEKIGTNYHLHTKGDSYTPNDYGFGLYLAQHWRIDMAPQFGETYLATIFDGDGAVEAMQPVTVPDVSMEVNFNEFDSAVSVGSAAQTHFYVGPVMVGGRPITGNYGPLLDLDATLYDRTWSTQDSWTFTSNRSYADATGYNAAYYKDGIFVIPSDEIYSAADMLTLDAKITIGGAVSHRKLPIAVQPPV